MSDKPQETREDDDILDQIISQGLNRINSPPTEDAPAEEAPAEGAPPAPGQEDGGGRPAPPEKKNRRTFVYIYLIILFGSAFLMLLLAYFVQQRYSETAINDLRNTMNLSRAELMEQIKELEEKNTQYEDTIQAITSENADSKEKIQELEQEISAHQQSALRLYWEKDLAAVLAWLERFCSQGDWLMAAVIVEQEDYCFNSHSEYYDEDPLLGLGSGVPPVYEARWLELREQVFDNAGCMEMSSKAHGSDYVEHPEIQADDSRADDISAARNLWLIFSHYSRSEYVSAAINAEVFYADSGNLERLNSGQFQPSTVELLEQVKADLMERGRKTRTARCGTLSCFGAPIPLDRILF